MRPEMEKTYDHARVESALYKSWEERGYFHARPNTGKPPYTIVIPPPNITGKLHMGHAIDETLQDVFIQTYCVKTDRILQNLTVSMY